MNTHPAFRIVILAALLAMTPHHVFAQTMGVGIEFASVDPIRVTVGDAIPFELVARDTQGNVVTDWNAAGIEVTLLVENSVAAVDTNEQSWRPVDDPDGYTWSRLLVNGLEIQPSQPNRFPLPRALFTNGRAQAVYRLSKAEENVRLRIIPDFTPVEQISPPITTLHGALDGFLVDVTTHIPDPAAARVYLMRPMQVIVTPRDRFLNTITDSMQVHMAARFPGELLPPPPEYSPSLLDSNLVLSGVSQFFALASSERRQETSSQPQRITIVRQGTSPILSESSEIYVERHMPNPFVLREPVDDTMLDLRDTPDDSVITLSWQRANPPDPCTGITVNRFDPSTYNDTVRYTVTFYDPASMKSGAWTVSDRNGLDTTASITVRTMKTILKSFFPFWTGGAASIIWFVKASDGLYDILSERVGTKLGNRLRFNFGTLGVTSPSPDGEFSLLPGYPNPMRGNAVIPFSLSQRCEATLTLHDMLGRELQIITSGTMDAGPHTVPVDLSGLQTGTYIVRLTAGGQTRSQRMTLIE